MAAAAVSADHGKRELEALLTKALEAEKVEDMEEIFHTIVDRSNQLRRQYGLPVRMDGKDTTSILKTNLEQLKLVGAESEIVYGSAIMTKASKRTNKTTQPSKYETRTLSTVCGRKESNIRRTVQTKSFICIFRRRSWH